jgi:hypothetical protein
MIRFSLDALIDPSACAISDEAAAYIADALMELALQFESAHFDKISRHYQSVASERDEEREYTDLFGDRRLSDKDDHIP